ncbi:DUF624 domain-containing protein [Ruminococcaceae bacterium OttesenSCG-928-A16]|nr:DUF624 domain-containing protein [Ruminococcaceae bacterium OttesenSCG-928-A16]
MALFKNNYNKPGPGVPKNAPKKKGFARFFEIFGRDSGNLVKLNLLVFVCELPSVIAFIVAIMGFLSGQGQWFMLFLLLALVLSFPVGPARTAEAYILTKMLRDDPGFAWHDFKAKFKENFKTSLVPGLIFSAVTGSQILAGLYFFLMGAQIHFVWVAVYIVSVLLFSMAAPYFFVQAAYLDLKTGPMLKNSLFLAMGYMPRSFAGAIINLLLMLGQGVLIFLVFPPAIILPVLLGRILPSLINTMWAWPQIDKTFTIDKTLKKREADRLDEQMGTPGEATQMVEQAVGETVAAIAEDPAPGHTEVPEQDE